MVNVTCVSRTAAIATFEASAGGAGSGGGLSSSGGWRDFDAGFGGSAPAEEGVAELFEER
ncbi:MAG: hypothetical protein EDR02_11810 [Actinobacteria bacterium]|nr:MAG: hypothetical protein EDR02_11810 [Actinomycetota bacterium]RIK07167.1 MAG: hypothetical protein DCC48_05130 [Acidobacteriota bacterium]